MSKVVAIKREREHAAFADRLGALESLLKREAGIDPETAAAKLLTAEQVAELFGLKLGTIRNMTHRKELPCVKLNGRTVRYRYLDILALIEARSAARLV